MATSSPLSADYRSAYRPLRVDLPAAPNEGLAVVRDAAGTAAAAGGGELAWDAEVLGFPCARVDELVVRSAADRAAAAEALSELARGFDARGVCLADLRVGLHAYPLVHAAEEAGFRLADVLNIYLSRRPPPPLEGSDEVVLCPGGTIEPSLRRAAEELAEGQFAFSRLYRDPRVPRERADAFYRRLASHLLADERSVAGLAQGPDGRLDGFFLGRAEAGPGEPATGTLWLIAVRPGRAGTGLGSLLLNRFLRALHERCDLVEIGTQVDHGAANRLYQAAGLPVVANAATLHRWNPCAS